LFELDLGHAKTLELYGAAITLLSAEVSGCQGQLIGLVEQGIAELNGPRDGFSCDIHDGAGGKIELESVGGEDFATELRTVEHGIAGGLEAEAEGGGVLGLQDDLPGAAGEAGSGGGELECCAEGQVGEHHGTFWRGGGEHSAFEGEGDVGEGLSAEGGDKHLEGAGGLRGGGRQGLRGGRLGDGHKLRAIRAGGGCHEEGEPELEGPSRKTF